MVPESVRAIYNFVPLSDDLASGGQPTEDELRELAKAGYECVVNLGLLGTSYALADEAGLVTSLGLGYHHLPVDFAAPSLASVEAFVRVMDAEGSRRVFVHCAANYRVSCFIALYGQARLGWSPAQANRHISRLWQPDRTWEDFLHAARIHLGLEMD